MLAQTHRLRTGRLFAETIRRGRRAGTPTMVLHLGLGQDGHPTPRVGLVVGKAVGNAVTRNQVKRRIRHIARERLTSLPATGVLVVRALPAAGTATSVVLARDFDSSLGRVLAGDRR